MWKENGTKFDNYYFGLGNNPKLLARSNRAPWKPPPTQPAKLDPAWQIHPYIQLGIVKSRHPLSAKLRDSGLRNSIREVLATMTPPRWISVDYLRIGYDDIEENNPVVALVSVEEQRPRGLLTLSP